MILREKKNLMFVGDKYIWQMFRQACKLKHTDASKEIRKLMDRYIEENLDLIIEDNERIAQEKELSIRIKAEMEHEKQSKIEFK